MSDYISRQAAIEAIRGCTEYYHNNMPTMIDKASAQTELMMLPTADVVKVVRCKDCEYWDDHERCDFWSSIMSPQYPEKNDYCSYGERAEA